MIVLADLRVEHCREPLGLWTPQPRFSWKISGSDHGIVQHAYEIEVLREEEGRLVWSSGQVASSESVLVPYEGPALQSAARYVWRVRAAAARQRTPWAEGSFETSLLRRSDWVARFVEPEQQPVTPDGPRRVGGDWLPPQHEGPPEERLRPAKYLRQSFELRARPLRARLYATSHGVYTAEINGALVGDQVLAPGYESYDKQLSFQTYDVTRLLTAGGNVLGMILGDGWYAGRIDFTGTSAQYGDRLQAGWQLVVHYADGEPEVLTSDATVVSSADGPVRYSDIFIGERHDARFDLTGWSSPGFDASGWKPVKTVPAPEVLVPFPGEPVRRVTELAPSEVLITPRDVVVDFGQVIAGRIRLRVRGPRGTVIKLEHSEVLDRDGNFFINIAGFNKDQTDYYILSGAPAGEAWEPLFTFHGFRYVRVTGYPAELTADAFRAVVIASDLEPAGDFKCSDARITRLHRNVVWSQRGNFLAIPTDCPQRERVGWTGDLQIFAPAATRNMKVISFLRRWLNNLRADQSPDGLVPVIVPAPPVMHALSAQLSDDPLLSRKAAAGWGDAVVIVPWVLYERYGDRLVLQENYAAMRAWVDRQVRVAESELPARLRGRFLTGREQRRQRLLWNSEPNFGDWNAPSVRAESRRWSTCSPSPIAPERSSERCSTDTPPNCSTGPRPSSVMTMTRSGTASGRNGSARPSPTSTSTARGTSTVDCQGAYVLALAFGQVPAAAAGGRAVTVDRADPRRLQPSRHGIPLRSVPARGPFSKRARRPCPDASLAGDSTVVALRCRPRGHHDLGRMERDPAGRAKSGRRRSTTTRSAAWTSGSTGTWPGSGRLRPGSAPAGSNQTSTPTSTGSRPRQDTPYGLLKVRWERDADDPALRHHRRGSPAEHHVGTRTSRAGRIRAGLPGRPTSPDAARRSRLGHFHHHCANCRTRQKGTRS